MEENIELNKIEESKDPTQLEQEIQQKEVEKDPVTPKSAGTPTGNIIQFRKGTKAAYSSSSNIDPNTISVVSNADGTSTGTFSEIYLGDDMIGCGHNFVNYTSSSNPGRAGLVPAPGSGDAGKFLSVDGWSTIPASAIPTLDYVTALGTSGNNVTWTKNGVTNNLTVPYATKALQDGNGKTISSTYLPLSGGNMDSGATVRFSTYGTRYLTVSGNNIVHDLSSATGGYAGSFYSIKTTGSDGETHSFIGIGFYGSYGQDTGLKYLYIAGENDYYSNPAVKITPEGFVTFKNAVTANSFVKTGGTSSQFLKADGSVDSNTYATTTSLGSYLPLAGGTMTGPITRLYSSASNSPMLKIGSNKQDIQIFKVYRSDTTYSDTGNLCGYSLVYAGTGSGVNNLLRLMADNTTTAGDKKKAITINQSGQVGILADPNTTYALHVNGKVHAVTDVTSPGFKVETSDTLNGYEYIKANGSGYGGVYSGATSSIAGTPGLVPSAAIADRLKYLRGDGTWASVSTSDTNVDQVGLDTSTERYPLILKDKDNTTNENSIVKFSKLGSASPVLSASPDGKIFAAGVAIVNDSTGLVPLYSNNEYVKADGSGAGGIYTGADIHNEQDGAPGLVPAAFWKEAEYYLRGDGTWHNVLADVGSMIPSQDHKVTMTATATSTGKYPLLFKYSTSYTSNETNYVRFSKVASSSASILSATPAGDLYSKSLTASGGSITLAANAATPTNELVIKNTATTNATPKLRFQRAETGDTYNDWTIQNNSSGSLVVSLETTSSSAMLTMTSSGSSFGGNVSAAGTLTAGTSITATNGDIICTHSGKYFKGLLYPNATASSAYIYTHANQPLTTTGNQSEDTKPVTAKNVVQYVTSAVGNYLPLAGGTMTGNISMGGSNNITNMLDGVNSSDAATVGQALVKESINDDTYFNAEGLRIFAVATPQSNSDAANKAYVDSRLSSVTISTQDISYDQLDGKKDFNVATVAIPSGGQNQQNVSYYLNFTNKMEKGSICHVMLHTSYSGETANPTQVNYASTPVVVKIPANIRVWDATGEGAESGDMEYVWINGDKVMECDVSNTSSYNGYGKAFTIPSGGFVEISVFFVRDECTIKKGDTYQTIKVFRTIIKVDAPTSTYSPPV